MQSMRVMSRNAIARMLVAACLSAAPIPSACAQDYPSRPLPLVVRTPPGGGTARSARIAAAQMTPVLAQPIVVETRGGAGAPIAPRQVAHAAGDGYTLMVATSSLAINPSIYQNVGYDPGKDFSAIGLMAVSQNVLLVHPSVEASSVKELIARAKAAPGKLTFAS